MKTGNVVAALVIASAVVGCGRGDSSAATKPVPMSLAAKYCVSSGYQYVQESAYLGVCFNPATNKKCEAWKFHRKACTLE